MVTFCVTVFQLVLLFFQVIYYIERRSDKQRSRYLILITLVILYNVFSGGVTPDERIPINMTIQNIVAYFLGFTLSMYAIYFFYKLFELRHLKFLATYGLFIFLFVSFVGAFVTPYLLTGDLAMSRRLTMVIPFFYGIIFVASATRALLIKIKESKEGLPDTLYLAITAYISMVCWASLPVINFLGDFQLLEHSVVNASFLMMTVFYVRSATQEHKREVEMQLQESPTIDTTAYEEEIGKYNLTARERELLPLLLRGDSYKQIGDQLHISENTASKHASNIYLKAKVANRAKLVDQLLPFMRSQR